MWGQAGCRSDSAPCSVLMPPDSLVLVGCPPPGLLPASLVARGAGAGPLPFVLASTLRRCLWPRAPASASAKALPGSAWLQLPPQLLDFSCVLLLASGFFSIRMDALLSGLCIPIELSPMRADEWSRAMPGSRGSHLRSSSPPASWKRLSRAGRPQSSGGSGLDGLIL